MVALSGGRWELTGRSEVGHHGAEHELGPRFREAIQEALSIPTAQSTELVDLVLGLDAFGDDLNAEPVAEVDDRGDEYRSHGEGDNEITSLHAPDMVDIKGRIGEKKDQIDDRNVAQSSKAANQRHAHTRRAVELPAFAEARA